MNRIMFLVGVIAVSVLLFAPAATAHNYKGGGSTMEKSATHAVAKAPNRQEYRKITTGGPPLAAPAVLVLIGSVAATTVIVRRYVSS